MGAEITPPGEIISQVLAPHRRGHARLCVDVWLGSEENGAAGRRVIFNYPPPEG